MGTKEEGIFRNYLRGRGLKFTPERQVILEEVFSLHRHFDNARILKRGVFSRAL
jgi:Fe2+ or Zn2+ uptake regulation protein